MNIKLIIITLLVHTCRALSDYCKIENNDCNVKHIGCVKNTDHFDRYTQGVINIRLIDLSDRQRNEIFYKFNWFKNRIASGTFNEFPSAANMKKIDWNNEFEYLAELYAQKIPFDIHLCTLTEETQATYYHVYQNIGGNENVTSFIDDGIESFFNELKLKDLPWIASYFAETEQLGCGIAEFTIPVGKDTENDVADRDIDRLDDGTVMVAKFLSMRCIFDTISETRHTYQIGEPCSLCNNTNCDEVFTSLCKE